MPPSAPEYLAARHPGELKLGLWTRDIVLAAEPELADRVYEGWDGIGFRHPDAGYICAIYPRPGEVRLLFEHGTRLDDPSGLLEGDGTQTRHVALCAADDELREPLTALVRDAVAERLFRR